MINVGEMVIPVGRTVLVILKSEDRASHGFWVPALLGNVEFSDDGAVAQLMAETEGVYLGYDPLTLAKFSVRVLSQDAFEEWIKGGSSAK